MRYGGASSTVVITQLGTQKKKGKRNTFGGFLLLYGLRLGWAKGTGTGEEGDQPRPTGVQINHLPWADRQKEGEGNVS